jgi:hypothetical protein
MTNSQLTSLGIAIIVAAGIAMMLELVFETGGVIAALSPFVAWGAHTLWYHYRGNRTR